MTPPPPGPAAASPPPGPAAPSPAARPPRRRRRAALVAIGVAGLAACAAAAPLARALPDRLLVEASPPRPADALVVLAGDHRGRRVEAAAALFRAGHVPRGPFVVSGGPLYGETTWARLMADHAERLGVPRARIVEQGRSETTTEDARLTAPLLRAAGARVVLLVTSPWHSRRAAAEFRAAAPDLEVVSCPSAPEGPPDWWTDPVATRALATEVLKHAWP